MFLFSYMPNGPCRALYWTLSFYIMSNLKNVWRLVPFMLFMYFIKSKLMHEITTFAFPSKVQDETDVSGLAGSQPSTLTNQIHTATCDANLMWCHICCWGDSKRANDTFLSMHHSQQSRSLNPVQHIPRSLIFTV